MDSSRRRRELDDTDGYYFRETTGQVHGPLTRFAYETYSLSGLITPTTRVWRQQAGNTYRISISRKFRWRKLLSIRAVSTFIEWCMMASTVGMLVFLFTLDKLRAELRDELKGQVATAFFFFALLTLTIYLTVGTMRKLSRAVFSETTEVCESEV